MTMTRRDDRVGKAKVRICGHGRALDTCARCRFLPVPVLAELQRRAAAFTCGMCGRRVTGEVCTKCGWEDGCGRGERGD